MKPYTLLMSQMPLRPEDYPPGFAAYVQPLLDARQRILQRLSDEERSLCHQILEMFFRCGRGPTIDELISAASFSTEKITECIERLNSIDFLKYDASTRQVVVLYPFSALPGPDLRTNPRKTSPSRHVTGRGDCHSHRAWDRDGSNDHLGVWLLSADD